MPIASVALAALAARTTMLSFVSRTARLVFDGGTTAALLVRLAEGDRGALEAIYRAEAAAVYRYALALCSNPAWAADATQDSFIALAERPQAFDAARGTLGAYLAGVARHALLARWRDARAEVAADVDDDVDALAADALGADAASPETLFVRAQASHQVWAALRALPWIFREALVLVDLQERSYAEAAAIAGIEPNTLRTRLHRARLRLAQRLGAADAAKALPRAAARASDGVAG